MSVVLRPLESRVVDIGIPSLWSCGRVRCSVLCQRVAAGCGRGGCLRWRGLYGSRVGGRGEAGIWLSCRAAVLWQGGPGGSWRVVVAAMPAWLAGSQS